MLVFYFFMNKILPSVGASMKTSITSLVFLLLIVFTHNLAADEFICGRIKDVWPPPLPSTTGTTCKTGVQAATPQEAFVLCTTAPTDGKNCCENNVVHKNIKGVAVVKGNQVTHFQCP